MAFFEVDGLADLIEDFEDIASLPEDVIDDMLNAEADVVAKTQKRTAESMLHGKYYTGDLAKSIKKSKVMKNSDGASIRIQFIGTRKRGEAVSTNAEVAFVNEFGKRGQSPRPFIKTANDECAGEAVEKATEIHDAFLKSKNL
jgi:HK97 gp10 family phage protein